MERHGIMLGKAGGAVPGRRRGAGASPKRGRPAPARSGTPGSPEARGDTGKPRKPNRLASTRVGRTGMGAYRRWRALRGADRAALTAAGSMLCGVALALAKFGMGLWAHSVLFVITAAYYLVLCASRATIVISHGRIRGLASSVERLNREMGVYHRTGALMIVIGVSYALVSVTLFFVGSSSRYNDIIAITIATITVAKISVAVRSLVVARKERDPMSASIRVLSFVDALFSVVVMQNVLIDTSGEGNGNVSSGLFGVGLGVAVSIAGTVMLVRRGTKGWIPERGADAGQ